MNTNGVYFSAISVFDKALNADEIKELVDYYKEFYKNAPVPVTPQQTTTNPDL